MKLCHIIGARPQFVKYFALAQAEAARARSGSGPIEDVLVHTGQHYDYNMSKVFFDELGLKEPEHHLGVGSGGHADQTAQVLSRTETVLLAERPDAVVVYGDTNSTLGAALAAAKIHIPVVHVEAGLRSFAKAMPEEINRVLADHVSSVLFAPSGAGVGNLRREGFRRVAADGGLAPLARLAEDPEYGAASADDPLVVNCGDVMYDVLRHAVAVAARRTGVLEGFELSAGGYALLTLHRAENTDDPRRLAQLVGFVNETAGRPVLFPMHPRMRKVYAGSEARFADTVRIVDPVGYFDLLTLMQGCACVMTDSGGMQKEAFWLRVPCITLREETEWVETLRSGWNVLFRDYRGEHRPAAEPGEPYGDGRAAERIVAVLDRLYGAPAGPPRAL